MNYLASMLTGLISVPVPGLIQIVRSRLAPEHLSGAHVARLLRWLLVSGAASVGGGSQRVYYEWARIPSRNESAIAGSFLFILRLNLPATRLDQQINFVRKRELCIYEARTQTDCLHCGSSTGSIRARGDRKPLPCRKR